MEALTLSAIVFYLISSAMYCAYLFLQKDRLQKMGCYALLIGALIFQNAAAITPDVLVVAIALGGVLMLRGRTWLRAGILNHTATEADLDILLDDLRDLAARR